MDKEKIVNTLRRDPEVAKWEEAVLLCLDREEDVMLKEAWLCRLSDGDLQALYMTLCPGDEELKEADQVEVSREPDGEPLVVLRETRKNSRTHRPNGVKVPEDEEWNCSCVVLWNCGKEKLTAEGEWLAPGDYTWVQDVSLNDPEVQKALLELGRREDERLRREREEGRP